MPFDTTYRYFAFDPALLNDVGTLRESMGDLADTAPDHNGEQVQTLLCGLDNAETGKLRAIQLGTTAQPITLTDGRIALGGYWTEAVIAAFEAGQIDGEELTEAEVKTLQPVSDL
jgi:hypothetical protein